MGVRATPEGLGCVSDALAAMEDEASIIRGILSSCGLLDGIDGDLPGIGRPTALREKASIAAARQSRPSRAGMQVMPPTRSLFLSPTEKTRSTRSGRGSPGSAFFAVLCLLAAPSATIPGFRMICGTRLPLATMPPRRSSRSMRRQPQRPLRLRNASTTSPSSASRSIRASGFFRS